jgi:hypothetical protein
MRRLLCFVLTVFVCAGVALATDFAVFDNHKSIGIKVFKYDGPEVSFRKWKSDTKGREFVFGVMGGQFGLNDETEGGGPVLKKLQYDFLFRYEVGDNLFFVKGIL